MQDAAESKVLPYPGGVRHAPASLGMFFAGHGGDHALYGRDVAIRTFNTALWRHSSIERLDVFVPPWSVRQARTAVAVELRDAPRHRRRINVRSMDPQDGGMPEVWHDVAGDVLRPFRMRACARTLGWFPITATHHTISYQWMLHSFFLPLVLEMTAGDALVCTSQAARGSITRILDHVSEQLSRRCGRAQPFRGRLEVVPLGVDTDLFCPRDRKDARMQLGLAREPFVILWNGRLSFLDKCDLLPLIRVFRELVASNPTRQLRFVVAGSERQSEHTHASIREYAAQLQVADSVQLLGEIDARLRPLLYAAADIFVSPVDNVQETFGLTPLEAMACGVPQVVSNWDGYRDSVVDGETGFLVPTYWAECYDDVGEIWPILDQGMFDHVLLSQSLVVEPHALRRALQELIDNDTLRARLSDASRRRALAQFDWRHVITQYEELWTDLLSSSAPIDAPPARWYIPHTEAFREYASHVLDATARLELTTAGGDVVHGREQLPAQAWRRDLLDVRAATEALRLIAAGDATTLDDVSRRLTSEDGLTPARACRQVLWLIKYGFVGFDEHR